MRLNFSKAKIGVISTAMLLSIQIQATPARAQNSVNPETPEKLPDLSFLSKPVQSTPLSEEEKVNVGVYKKCGKAVVNIATVTTPEGYYYNIMPQEGIGSGTIISKDGYLVTNEHVVGASEMVRVTLFDGSSYAAKLVGKDLSNDLAVLKIQAPAGKQFDCIEIGNSSELEVGRKVLAIGNPFGYDQTMTQGMISSLGRTLRTRNNRIIKGIIQTDAAINPGNSGGPLLDTAGRMVAINTAIFTRAGQNSGIGFAIPANIIRSIVPELILHHRVLRPDIGILALQETPAGVRVIRLASGGPAVKAGLQGPKAGIYRMGPIAIRGVDISSADIISHVDNVRINTQDELLTYIEKKKPNQVVTLTVNRNGTILKIPVKLSVNSNEQ
ncbi:MAG: trypsin-like peptidase domain-containing protein [Cyanobacteriota/Melainabacteria group bacterium]